MIKHKLLYCFYIALCLVIFNCANRGTPSGGEKDEEPPKITKSVPENFSTNFNTKEIKISFDEYIKINDLRKNLIISPPMDPEPLISPIGSASKEIKIEILDTLSPNTTYAINFGESIVDNNEGNPYPFYRYVFSTGEQIDSLKLSGSVIDALNRTTDEYISVMLYEMDSLYTDSTIYKEKPRYITSTLDSTTTFNLENLKEGRYKLIALKDENSNYTYEPKTDKIGFINETVVLPTDTSYVITMFKEELDFKALKPRMETGQKLTIGFEGDPEGIDVKVLNPKPENYYSRLSRDQIKDSLYYWFRPKFDVDSLELKISKGIFVDTFQVRIRDMLTDSLEIKTRRTRGSGFGTPYELETNVPLEKIDRSLINLINRDSSVVDYEIGLDSLNNILQFKFEKAESENYRLRLLPGAIEDIFGDKNDTLNYTIRTKTYADYGNMRVVIENAQFPSIIELVDSDNNVEASYYLTKKKAVDFENLNAGYYFLRVIYDENKNGKYDPGNFLKGIQPEKVSYYPVPADTEVRASWSNVITFILQE